VGSWSRRDVARDFLRQYSEIQSTPGSFITREGILRKGKRNRRAKRQEGGRPNLVGGREPQRRGAVQSRIEGLEPERGEIVAESRAAKPDPIRGELERLWEIFAAESSRAWLGPDEVPSRLLPRWPNPTRDEMGPAWG